MVPETSPQLRSIIGGYTPRFRHDFYIDFQGWGIFLFVRENIPAKKMKTTPLKGFNGILSELNLRKKKNYYAVPITPIKSALRKIP